VFGINGAEFVVLLVVAVLVIGPERLPGYAEQLGGFVRTARGYLRDAKARVDAEIGAEVGDVDWSKLDPRQYDPRRIVREALLDDDDDPRPSRTTPPPPPARAAPVSGGPAPFDDEAT
jgi:sec-independent protein translocase protein TatB